MVESVIAPASSLSEAQPAKEAPMSTTDKITLKILTYFFNLYPPQREFNNVILNQNRFKVNINQAARAAYFKDKERYVHNAQKLQ